MEGSPVEPEEPSRGEALLEKLKASRLRPSQFRLTTIFGIMLFVGVVMAIPRFSGADYGWYFGFLYIILYGCAPFASWFLYFILPPTLVVGLTGCADGQAPKLDEPEAKAPKNVLHTSVQ